jgi:hypothetical protein
MRGIMELIPGPWGLGTALFITLGIGMTRNMRSANQAEFRNDSRLRSD